MKCTHSASARLIYCTLALTLITLACAPVASAGVFPDTPEKIIQEAWQRAADLGAYRFATEMTQVTYPAPALANVGRSPTQQTVHLEGSVDLPKHALNMQLWQGGSVLQPADAMEIKVEGDRAWGRQAGSGWQETQDFSGLWGPNNDLMVFLAGVKDLAPDAKLAGHYSFTFDGPAFARHMRDQLESYLIERGELPFNMHLDTSRVYQETTGDGEVWLNELGLPARLVVHLSYPAQGESEPSDADMDITFIYSGEVLASLAPQGSSDLSAGLQGATAAMQASLQSLTGSVAGSLPKLLFCGLLAAVLVIFVLARGSRRVYAAVVIATVLLMVVAPLLQNAQAAAFMEKQAAKQEQAEKEQRSQEIAKDVAADAKGANWDPHQDPLTGPSAVTGAAVPPADEAVTASDTQGPLAPLTLLGPAEEGSSESVDTDGDGLPDAAEAEIGSNPTLADSDSDGLNDYVEAVQLGTSSTLPDTDGDGIYDNVEVAGFDYAGLHWYTNPNQADTNGDTMPDGLECLDLKDVTAAPATLTQCDADNDNIPDLFDTDDDNDGVQDAIDSSPNTIVDRNGKRSNAGAVTPFDGSHPFQFQVSNLATGYPVVVDFQLEPINRAHLGYAMNVLDWPSADIDGQIQHVKNTTFADTDSPTARDTEDPRSAYGDTRLIPLFELEISGSATDYRLPLRLTTPAISVTLNYPVSGGEPISATVGLKAKVGDNNQTQLTFKFDSGSGYAAAIYEGACPPSEDQDALYTFSGLSTGSVVYAGARAVDLADGSHSLTVSRSGSDGTDRACSDIGNIVNGLLPDKMVDPDWLKPYGVSIREADDQGTLLAYLPLNVEPDQTGGGKAAFRAHALRAGRGRRLAAGPEGPHRLDGADSHRQLRRDELRALGRRGERRGAGGRGAGSLVRKPRQPHAGRAARRAGLL